MDDAAARSGAVDADRSGQGTLARIGALRWLTLLAFNVTYVVVPLLLFERTGSLALVGVAMIGEGLLRALLSLWVGRWARGRSPLACAAMACTLRLAALAMLAWTLNSYSVVIVALASTLFYIGHFFATFEQELRSATFGARAVAAQTVHRIAEVLAPPVAFAIALVARARGHDYEILIACATAAVAVQALVFFAWFRDDPPPTARAAPGLVDGWVHLRGQPALLRGLVASIIGFTFFGWAVLATPFALTGRALFGLALDSAAGIALFKVVAALVGVGGALLAARWLARAAGERLVIVAAVAAPLAFALGLSVSSDALAVALLALMAAMVLGLFTWQRRLRQVLATPEHFHGVTTWCMALESLHVSLIGAALIVDRPWTLALGGSLALALLLRGRTRR